MTRRELVLGAALLVVLAGGGGYVVARATDSPPSAGHVTAPSMSGSSSPGRPRESATGYSNNQLAQSIARQAGTRLADSSPAYVSASSARALGTQVPPGASAAPRTNTITFSTQTVAFTVVAVPPGGPDMTFRIGGLVNPTLVVPYGASVHVEFINADSDEAHGWEVTGSGPPFEFVVR